MFSLLYELLVGKNPNPQYARNIYPAVGLITLILSALFALIFYLFLGRWKPIWDKQKHWLVTIVLLAVTASGFAYSQALSTTGDDSDSYMVTFSFINALYAVVYFIILSLLLKRASIFAKRTPF